MNNPIKLVLLFSCLVLVSACATTTPDPAAMGNLGQLLSQFEGALSTAKANQVDVLAPGLYDDAQSAYMKAQNAFEKGEKLTTISKYVADGQTSLKKAEEIAQVSRTILGETNKAREKALKVGASGLGKPYRDVEAQYLKLTKAIENDNLSYAQKHAAEVQAAFRDVEIMAIKNNAIGSTREMMSTAERAKIEKIAPTAYQDALQALQGADAYIGQNPYAADAIAQKAAHAEFMAQRMNAIVESSRQFAERTPEASALYVEQILTRLGKVTGAGDLRDKRVETQVGALIAAIESAENESQTRQRNVETLQAEVATLKSRLAGLQGYSREQELAKQRLAEEREFNQQFERVRRYFRPDEAEVYKQGNQLVIRLRGIQFPVGQATLSPENYTLLSKVQQAIGRFNDPTVTVEGHTDSTGSAQMNQELSEKRAEAVKTYLVANRTLPANRIQAIGYGPSRPLAPETTPEGRAMNRRIDVLVTPSRTP